jgi:tRNAThr (cytosine32-N3)-methyltransferase
MTDPDGNASAEYGPHNRSRFLNDEEEVWDFNCWDNIAWDSAREQEAEAIVASQRANSIMYQERHGNEKEAAKLKAALDAARSKQKWLRAGPTAQDLDTAAGKWDEFYEQHERWFFKDRNWLLGEFKELFHDTEGAIEGNDQVLFFPAARRIIEIGCGAGNTVFPLWKERRVDPVLERIYACDFSSKAVDLVRSYRDFDPSKMTTFVHDLSSEAAFPADVVAPGSIDVAVTVFVLSALKPEHLAHALSKIYALLRPGGLLLFRDYGRYDLTQLRLKPDRMIDDDFYFRGDGTTVYFFTTEKVCELARNAGFAVLEDGLRDDRRLITNRLRKLKMYRNWVQGKFMKPFPEQ